MPRLKQLKGRSAGVCEYRLQRNRAIAKHCLAMALGVLSSSPEPTFADLVSDRWLGFLAFDAQGKIEDYAGDRMTMQGVESISADRAALLEIGRSLSEEEWALPSDCAGWDVKDVYVHLWLTFARLLDPASNPTQYPNDVEKSIDYVVDQHRNLSPSEVLRHYEEVSERGLRRLRKMQAPETRDIEVALDNLGTYPVWQLANANAFDHHAHLRFDLVAPTGPLERTAPPAGELQLAPTIVWMTAGLPQMCREALAGIDGSVSLSLVGPGGGTWRFEGGEFPKSEAPADATIRSTTEEFVIWGTCRRPWAERNVTLHGDEKLATRFCDAVNVI